MSQYYRTELAEFKDDNLDFLIDDLDLITKRDDKDNLLTSGEVSRFSDEATDDPIYSTMVEIEIQFLTDDNPDLDPTTFTSFFPVWVLNSQNPSKTGWIDRKIWINPLCVQDMQADRQKCKINRKYSLNFTSLIDFIETNQYIKIIIFEFVFQPCHDVKTRNWPSFQFSNTPTTTKMKTEMMILQSL